MAARERAATRVWTFARRHAFAGLGAVVLCATANGQNHIHLTSTEPSSLTEHNLDGAIIRFDIDGTTPVQLPTVENRGDASYSSYRARCNLIKLRKDDNEEFPALTVHDPGHGKAHCEFQGNGGGGLGYVIATFDETDELSDIDVDHQLRVHFPGSLLASGAELTSRGTVQLMGRGFITSTVEAVVETAPLAPQALTATPGDGEVVLAWRPPPIRNPDTESSDNSRFDKHQVRHEAAGGLLTGWRDMDNTSWSDIDATGRLGHTVTGLENNTLHVFQIRAVVIKAADAATNEDGTGPHVEVSATPASSDNTLSDLVVATTPETASGGGTVPGTGTTATLVPAFEPGTTDYDVEVAHTVRTVTVTPTSNHDGATIRVQGLEVVSGETSGPIPVGDADTTVAIVVTAQNGDVITYRITVSRLAPPRLSELTLAHGDGPTQTDVALTPAFAPDHTAYTATVGDAVDEVAVTPTAAEGTNDTITVSIGTVSHEVNSGSGQLLSVQPGANTITIVAENMGPTTTYTVTLHRARSDNADLTDLSVDSHKLDPDFAKDTVSYAVTVPATTSSVTVRARVEHEEATVAIAGAECSNQGMRNFVCPVTGLQPGNNLVAVVVEAESDATKTYTLNIERESGFDLNLSALTISEGTLAPAFDPAVAAGYAAAVDNSVTSVDVTPTASDAGNVAITVAKGDTTGVAVESGAAHTVMLDEGSNVISVAVTATDDPTAKRTYSLTVTRLRQSMSDLTALDIVDSDNNAVTLSPAFAADELVYEASVASTVASVTVTPTAGGTTTIMMEAIAGATTTLARCKVTADTADPSRCADTTAVPVTLIPGANIIDIEADDGMDIKNYRVTIHRASAVDLLSLTIDPGQDTLTPMFAPYITAYAASVPFEHHAVTVTPIPFDASRATVTVAGTRVADGGSVDVDLDVGVNAIAVVVADANSADSKTYTVRVTRAEDDTLASLTFTPAVTLEPAFDKQQERYTGQVEHDVTSVQVEAVASDADAEVLVQGTPVGSGGVNVNLSVGDTIITIVVIAKDRNRKTYTVTLTRAGSGNADLSALVFVPDVALTPPFDPAVTVYSGIVDNDVSSLALTATVASAVATMTVGGEAVESGTAATVSLDEGANAIEVVVTAQDETQKTYNINVTRRSPVPVFSETVAPQEAKVGRFFSLQLPAAAAGDGTLTYTLAPPLPAGLAFAAATRTVSGTPTAEAPAAVYTLTATDRDGDTAALAFILEVRANLVPSFGNAIVDPQQAQVGRPFELQLPLAAGGDGTVAYTLGPALPDGLEFDAATLFVSGTPTRRWAPNTYTLTATDEDDDEVDLSFTLEVIRNRVPTFGTASVPPQHLRVGTAFELVLPTATGGDGALTYTLTPALPAGLAFTPETRAIEGTPTAGSPETEYTLTARDEDGDAGRVAFLLRVVDTAPSFGNARVDLEPLRVGTAFELVLPAATGGEGEVTYALDPALPDGLTFNAGTRTIAGTPTQAAEATTYTLTATDEDGDAAALDFPLEVLPDSRPHFQGITVPGQEFRVGSPVELALPEATGGDGAVTYTLAPELPAGLAFDAATRTIAGTPEEAMAPVVYTLLATDADRDRGALRFVLEVLPDSMPSFGDAEIAAQRFEVGAEVALALPAATGGDGTVAYTLEPALPAGLRFDDAGLVVAGVPTRVAPQATYTFTATDEDGDQASLEFLLEVDAVPSFGNAAVPSQLYHVGTPIAALTFPAAQGGDGRLTYSLEPALPDGLTFAPGQRRLSGTPSAEAPRAGYTFAATDRDGDTATLRFDLEVGPPITVSIADTLAPEGRQLEFPVTLSAPAQVPLSVVYRTADGTALADQDYVPVSARTLVFAPGETTLVAAVQVFGDEVPEPDETLRVTLSEPVHTSLGVAHATGTIVDDDAERVRASALKGSMGAFGRVMMADAVDVIGERFMEGPPSKSRATIGGFALGPGEPAGGAVLNGVLRGLSGGDGDSRRRDPGDVVGRSDFVLHLSGASARSNGSPWTLWGRGSIGHYAGTPENMDLEGNVQTAYLGLDAQVRDNVRLGLAVSHGRAEIAFGKEALFDGTVDLAMTSVLPYAHWTLRDGMDLWATVGAGQGAATLEDQLGSVEPDLRMYTAATGGRNDLAIWQGIDIAAKADLLAVTMRARGQDAALDARAFAGRVRAMLEARRDLSWADGFGLGLSVEAGARWDTGDAGDAFGAEVATGVMYRQQALGLGVDARGRALLVQSGKPSDWGASLSLEFDPGLVGTGFRFQLGPTWGAPGSRVDGLWRGRRQHAGGDSPYPLRGGGMELGAQAGYGFPARNGAEPRDVYARLFEDPLRGRGYRLGGGTSGASVGWRWELERRDRFGERPAYGFVVEWRRSPRRP